MFMLIIAVVCKCQDGTHINQQNITSGVHNEARRPQTMVWPILPLENATGLASADVLGLAGGVETDMAEQAMPAGPGILSASWRGAVGDVDWSVSQSDFQGPKGEENFKT